MPVDPRSFMPAVQDQLLVGLRPFVITQSRQKLGAGWLYQVKAKVRSDFTRMNEPEEWDLLDCFNIVEALWADVFCFVIRKRERSWISELRTYRNDVAHSTERRRLTADDVARALDTAARLLKAIGAQEQAHNIEQVRRDLAASQEPAKSPERLGPAPPLPQVSSLHPQRATQSDRIFACLTERAPRRLMNSELSRLTGITPHQAVFAATRRLHQEGRIKGEQHSRGWEFWVERT